MGASESREYQPCSCGEKKAQYRCQVNYYGKLFCLDKTLFEENLLFIETESERNVYRKIACHKYARVRNSMMFIACEKCLKEDTKRHFTYYPFGWRRLANSYGYEEVIL